VLCGGGGGGMYILRQWAVEEETDVSAGHIGTKVVTRGFGEAWIIRRDYGPISVCFKPCYLR
jgi:hypothetical protein